MSHCAIHKPEIKTTNTRRPFVCEKTDGSWQFPSWEIDAVANPSLPRPARCTMGPTAFERTRSTRALHLAADVDGSLEYEQPTGHADKQLSRQRKCITAIPRIQGQSWSLRLFLKTGFTDGKGCPAYPHAHFRQDVPYNERKDVHAGPPHPSNFGSPVPGILLALITRPTVCGNFYLLRAHCEQDGPAWAVCLPQRSGQTDVLGLKRIPGIEPIVPSVQWLMENHDCRKPIAAERQIAWTCA